MKGAVGCTLMTVRQGRKAWEVKEVKENKTRASWVALRPSSLKL